MRSVVIFCLCVGITLCGSIAGLTADPVHFIPISSTGNSATIAIPEEINPIVDTNLIAVGDEVAVYDSTGTCVGAEAWDGGSIAVTVHGDDNTEAGQLGIMPGEPYRFRMWDAETDQEYEATATFASGDSTYTPNDLPVLATLRGEIPVGIENTARPLPFSILSVSPNPFNNAATVTYDIAQAGRITLAVYTSTGQLVRKRELGYQVAGRHGVLFDGTGLSSGTYLISLTAGDAVSTIRATLLK